MARPETSTPTVAEARAYLSESARSVNPVLHAFWEEKRRVWAGFPGIVRGAFDAYDDLTGDGKKIRAGLVLLGHVACRHAGSPASPASDSLDRAAGCVEILHNAFLIHDDIVDRSDLRRNQPTVHRRYADERRARFAREEDALAYGQAVALNFGDKGQALAQELLISSGFPQDVLLPAIALLSQVTAETVAGQLLDVEDVRLTELTEDLVLRIHEYKTAHYTIMLPLQLGAILARAEAARLAPIRAYAVPIGIAFQIQDDVLGLYGDEAMLGKPVDSDVKEGKKTLLFVHARERAGDDDRRFLERVHGNPAIGADDLDRVRGIVRATGALARSEEMARALVAQGKAHIAEITAEPRWQRVLAGVGDYLIERRY
jgi:geranylgeranyl diphosphate synthase, type I